MILEDEVFKFLALISNNRLLQIKRETVIGSNNRQPRQSTPAIFSQQLIRYIGLNLDVFRCCLTWDKSFL